MELVRQIATQLGIGESQAKGGVGLLLKLAETQLSGSDFGLVKDAIPEASTAMAEAPAAQGGLVGTLGRFASSFGGVGKQVGAMAQLAGGLQKLGLDADKLTAFVPIMLTFVESRGGTKVRQLLEGVLKL